MKNHRLIATLMLLAVSAIWGAAAPVIKFTLAYFPPAVFLTYRFAISFLAAILIWTVKKPRLPQNPKRMAHMTVASILAFPLSLGLLFWGYDMTTSLSGTVISTISPLVVVFLGAFFLHDRVTKTERTGIFLALAGTFIAIIAPLLNGFTPSDIGSIEGNLLIIASVVVNSVSLLLTKITVREHVEPDTFTAYSFILAFVTFIPVFLYSGSPETNLRMIATAPLPAHLGVFYMALLSGIVAYFMQNRAIRTVELSETALFTYLYPVWAAPLSILWLHERVTWVFLLGSAVIAAGVFMAERKGNGNGRLTRRRRH